MTLSRRQRDDYISQRLHKPNVAAAGGCCCRCNAWQRAWPAAVCYSRRWRLPLLLPDFTAWPKRIYAGGAVKHIGRGGYESQLSLLSAAVA